MYTVPFCVIACVSHTDTSLMFGSNGVTWCPGRQVILYTEKNGLFDKYQEKKEKKIIMLSSEFLFSYYFSLSDKTCLKKSTFLKRKNAQLKSVIEMIGYCRSYLT